jgi:hypothetical protein
MAEKSFSTELIADYVLRMEKRIIILEWVVGIVSMIALASLYGVCVLLNEHYHWIVNK